MHRVVIALAAAAFSGAAWPQSYPAKPVKIVVPYGVGGSADVYARYLGAKLQDTMGQSFVVENRPGAGSIVGTDYVAKSPADGYTLLMMSNTHTVNETLIPKKPFDLMRDFAPITGVSYSDLLMVVHTSVPANNLREFVALAKARPGGMNYASSGNGTPYHLAGELFKALAGVDLVHIPHKGSDQARTSILGGQVQMMFDAVPTMAANARAARPDGAGGDAAPGAGEAQRRGEQAAGLGRGEGKLGQAGHHHHGHVDRPVRQVPARGDRQVGEGGEAGGRESRLVPKERALPHGA
ncbi:MAG: tripartite tricarboxylate transporter substrate-binding protein [Betaproteobacteria bacterium]